MAKIEGAKGFNNLLFQTNKRSITEKREHMGGHIPLDLSYKGNATIMNVLTAKASQINGKHGDIKYFGSEKHSRPYLNYDAPIDPTILNAVRNKLVDVSGLLIPNHNLKKNTNINMTQRPFKSVGIVL